MEVPTAAAAAAPAEHARSRSAGCDYHCCRARRPVLSGRACLSASPLQPDPPEAPAEQRLPWASSPLCFPSSWNTQKKAPSLLGLSKQGQLYQNQVWLVILWS